MTTLREIQASVNSTVRGEAKFKVSAVGSFLALRAEIDAVKTNDLATLRARVVRHVAENFADVVAEPIAPAAEIHMGGLVINFRLQ